MKSNIMLIISAVLLTTACTTSEIDNAKASVGGDPNPDDVCIDVSEGPIGWTEKSEIGLSPRDIFDEVGGSCRAPFRWDGTGWDDALVVEPESGETIIVASIEVDHQSAVFIKKKPNDFIGGTKPPCSPTLEVSAQVTLWTEDGAFKESIATTVTYSKDFPRPAIAFTLPAERLGGTLEVEATENWNASLGVQIMPIQRDCAGTIGLSAQRKVNDRESAGAGQGTFASWSITNCEFGTRPVDLSEPYRGVILKEKIETLWGDTVYNGVWDDDQSTDFYLELDLTSDTGCLEEMETISVVSIPISTTSYTSDGRIIRMTAGGLLHVTFENDTGMGELDFWTSEEIECEGSFDLRYASIDCSQVDYVTAQLSLNQYFSYDGTNGGTVELYIHNIAEMSDSAPGAADSVQRLQLWPR